MTDNIANAGGANPTPTINAGQTSSPSVSKGPTVKETRTAVDIDPGSPQTTALIAGDTFRRDTGNANVNNNNTTDDDGVGDDKSLDGSNHDHGDRDDSAGDDDRDDDDGADDFDEDDEDDSGEEDDDEKSDVEMISEPKITLEGDAHFEGKSDTPDSLLPQTKHRKPPQEAGTSPRSKKRSRHDTPLLQTSTIPSHPSSPQVDAVGIPSSTALTTTGLVNDDALPARSQSDAKSVSQNPKSSGGPLTKPDLSNSDKKGTGATEDLAKPVQTPQGLEMRIGDALLVTEDRLSEEKRARLERKQIKPIENMTFEDLRTYNRDQLRTYCFIYSIPRGKKTQMEARMARCVSMWNGGEGQFALDKYIPTSRNFNAAELTTELETPGTASAPSKKSDGNLVGKSSHPSIGQNSLEINSSSDAQQGPSNRTNSAFSNIGVSATASTHPPDSVDRPLRLSTPSAGDSGLVTPVVSAPPPTQAGTSVTEVPPKTTPMPKGGKQPSVAPTPQTIFRGANTSFKQKVHARHSGAKFKAAHNGAGPAIVNIVENAAAFFEGNEGPEVAADRAQSFARYQFNVALLTEIFDGPDDELSVDKEEALNEEQFQHNGGSESFGAGFMTTMRRVCHNIVYGDAESQAEEIAELECRVKTLEQETKLAERSNMRLLQRVERAETLEELESLKRELEKEHDIKFDPDPPLIKRRKIDKSLPMTNFTSDEDFRILQFNSNK